MRKKLKYTSQLPMISYSHILILCYILPKLGLSSFAINLKNSPKYFWGFDIHIWNIYQSLAWAFQWVNTFIRYTRVSMLIFKKNSTIEIRCVYCIFILFTLCYKLKLVLHLRVALRTELLPLFSFYHYYIYFLNQIHFTINLSYSVIFIALFSVENVLSCQIL